VDRLKAEGALDEAPKAPRRVGCREGCPPPRWGRDLGRGLDAFPRKFFII